MTLKTVRGQQIALYPAGGPVETLKQEHGWTYRLCQILPPTPQRFEWIRLDNLLEVPSEEKDRLRRTPRPQSSSARLARAEGRIEISPQQAAEILEQDPGLVYSGEPLVNWSGDAASQEHEQDEGRQAA